MTSDNSTLSPFASLPSELLWSILRLAAPPTIAMLPDGDRPPFAIKSAHLLSLVNTILKDKISLVYVCKCWRAIANEFLYEEVVVNDDTGWQLLAVLQTTAAAAGDASAGYGKYVRCIRTHRIGLHGIILIPDFLRCCPNLQILYEPDIESNIDVKHLLWRSRGNLAKLGPALAHSPLVSLRAMFWGEGTLDSETQQTAYSYLLEILEHAPNVVFLSIPSSPKSFQHLQHAMAKHPLAGKNIKYLELQSVPRTWILPARTWDVMLKFCPNLSEISHHVGRPVIIMSSADTTVKCLRLHLSSVLPPSENTLGAVSPELTFLTGAIVPSLERVVLHGNWSAVANIPTFRSIENALMSNGRRLIFADGAPTIRG
ncbi:hypothetical protein B0H10DRAFT_2191668 [Mycena sp. CBHHK59/15]|nr:hypothetical protein B0H10DRAFT_2191668 [Mycena sp. CBHHK59/15]